MTGYQDKEIKVTVSVPLQEVIVGTFTEDYHLSEVEFERIKTGQPKTLTFAFSLLWTTIAFAVALAPKVIDQGWSGLSAGELLTLVGLAAATALLLIIGFFLPNKRKEMLKKIDDHFKSAEPSKQAVERGKI